jgi:very-short-patch-repair endonuclease
MMGASAGHEQPLSRTAGEGAERSEAGEGQRRQPLGPPRRLTRSARSLRLNSTDAERRLWSALRSRRLQRYKFRRQFPIGPFIVDFACTRCLLIVEADGSQHSNSDYDIRRTAWLTARSWRVLRFWDNDVLTNIEGVSETILQVPCECHALTLPRLRRGPLPLPHCGRGAVPAERE